MGINHNDFLLLGKMSWLNFTINNKILKIIMHISSNNLKNKVNNKMHKKMYRKARKNLLSNIWAKFPLYTVYI